MLTFQAAARRGEHYCEMLQQVFLTRACFATPCSEPFRRATVNLSLDDEATAATRPLPLPRGQTQAADGIRSFSHEGRGGGWVSHHCLTQHDSDLRCLAMTLTSPHTPPRQGAKWAQRHRTQRCHRRRIRGGGSVITLGGRQQRRWRARSTAARGFSGSGRGGSERRLR